MEDLGIKIQLSEAWADGSATITPVTIAMLSGEAPEHQATFMLSAQDEKDRERIGQRFGVCTRCGGAGYVTASIGKHSRMVECTACRGKKIKADHPTVRLAHLEDCCHGWEGFVFLKGPAFGRPIPFTPAILKRISEDDGVYGVIVAEATMLKKDYTEAELGNSTSGPPTSPGTPPSQTTSSPAPDEF